MELAPSDHVFGAERVRRTELADAYDDGRNDALDQIDQRMLRTRIIYFVFGCGYGVIAGFLVAIISAAGRAVS